MESYWERRYIEAKAEKRSNLIRIYAMIAVAIYVICIVIDISNLFNPMSAIVVRLVCAAFFLTLATSMRWARVRDYGGIAVIVAATTVMLSSGYLGQFGSVEIHFLYNVGSLVVVILAIIGIPLGMWTTLAAALSCLVAYAGFTMDITEAPLAARLSATGFFSLMAVASLALNFAMERNERHRFLLQVRGELQRDELIGAGKALAIANAKLARVALTDSLTGIANRRRFDDSLVEMWRDAMKDGGGLGVVLIDVDHFKAYNDCYGHPAGDACLRAVAEALSAELRRAHDLVARYGGEEFVVLLRGSDVRVVAERLIACIQRLGLPHARRTDGLQVVTISAGCAVATPNTATSAADLVAVADRALYAAKQAGRNRVVIQG